MSVITDTMREWLQHAPKDPGLTAPELMGRETESGEFVCAVCAGRLAARGCRLPVEWDVVWKDQVQRTLTCATCDDVFDYAGETNEMPPL